jgi:predicted transposase YbfD/YdcC
VAFDGKALRGTNGHEAPHHPSVHLCAFYEVATGNVLAQREVQDKENEISAAKQMLTPALVKGCLISADAMHTQQWFCRKITLYEGDYLLIAKNNQPTMREDLELFFEDPDADRSRWQCATFVDKGHGRLEKRVITTSTEMRDWFAKEWCGIEQVFRVQRWVTKKGRTSYEVVYGITSLTPQQADAHLIGELIRAHWSIENRLHWRRDVTMQEDHSQVRTHRAPALLALLNSTILALMDLLGVSNVPAQMRIYAARPWEAVHLLLTAL